MAWYTVDRRLITIKAIYFLTLSALATLLPYLPIFLTQIGVKQRELAVIYFLIFFTTFFKNIVVGFVADRYQSHKLILILSCLFTGPLYASMLAIPPTSSSSQPLRASNAVIQCFPTSLLHNTTSYTNLPNGNIDLPTEDNTYRCIKPLLCESQSKGCLSSTSQICQLGCFTQNRTADGQTGGVIESPLNTSHISFSDSNRLAIYQAGHAAVQCRVSYDCEYKQSDYKSLTFWLCLTVGVIAALCGSNELMMNDAIALSLLGDDRRKWGKSRLWGTVGYGLSALLISLLIEKLSANASDMSTIDYTPAFYIYLLLSLASGAVAYFHPKGNVAKSSQALTGLGTILKNVRIISFLGILLFLGFFNGITMTYAYLYLRIQFLASQLNIGLCVMVTVIVEFPILFIGGWIVDRIGTLPCLYLALVAYAVKFIAYVFIPGPLWAIPIEATHMFTFGLMFTAANMHAGKITAKGYTGTIIGLINGIKWGLGMGLGSLLGGIFANAYKSEVDKFGYKTLFTVSGISAIVLLLCFLLINEVFIRIWCGPEAKLDDDVDDDKNIKISYNVKTTLEVEEGKKDESQELMENERNEVNGTADQEEGCKDSTKKLVV